MLAKLGLAALVILVGSETFALSAAVLWPLAALSHLGAAVQNGALILSGLLGVVAGVAIFRMATANRDSG